MLQIETFATSSDVWQLTPSSAGDFSRQGLTLRASATLEQTAVSTFGFLRVKLLVELLGDDEVTLTLQTSNEKVTIGRNASSIYASFNGEVVVTQPFAEAHCTLQLVLNDQRVGCLVIGQRIVPLLSRQAIASFNEQPYEFIVSSSITNNSIVVIEEVMYESVNE